MSQIEVEFQKLLSRKPEIEKCYAEGLINRRALARYLIEKNVAGQNQLDAVIAMLRRHEFRKLSNEGGLFKELKTSIKDNIVILNFEKEQELLQYLSKVVAQTNYNLSETLKVIVGTSNVTIIIDKDKEKGLKLDYKILHRLDDISEISLQFPKKAINSKGIISFISRELYVNDIAISEMLTASSELLIYLDEKDVIRAYEIIKELSRKR
jgi:hypothetical protein